MFVVECREVFWPELRIPKTRMFGVSNTNVDVQRLV
jgi:hypothetical protein